MATRGRRKRARAGKHWFGKPLVSLALLDAAFGCTCAYADEGAYNLRNTFGEVGLLDMPSARMSDDGQIGVTLTTLSKNIQRYNFSFQVLPWLQGSFRYSRIAGSNPALITYYDRSFGLKMRLSQEDEYLPELSVGIRDLLGTGIYGSEYLVASKQIGDLDFTAGLGWGRLADNKTLPNPLGYLLPSFKKRKPLTGLGGKVDFGQFFRGPNVGLFGGVVWNTPINNLSAIVEYSGDDYKFERGRSSFDVKIPVNIGLSYQFRTAAISAGWFYGTSYGATLTLTLDPTKNLFPAKIGVPPLPATNRSDAQKTAALSALLEKRDANLTAQNAPSLPVSQALFGLARGVHNVTLDENRLSVAVSLNPNETLSCASYATLAGRADVSIRSVTVTDIGNGRTESCAAPQAVQPAQLSWVTASRHAPAIIDATGAGGTVVSQNAPSVDPFNKIRQAAAAQSLKIDALSISRSELIVYYENSRYLMETEAVGRLLRILMTYAPPDNEVFRIVTVQSGVPVREVRVLRSAIERTTEFNGGTQELGRTISVQLPPMQNTVLDSATDSLYPRYSWSISPQTRQSVFDPNSPLQVQAFVTGKAGVEILPGLSVSTQLDLNIWNNFVNKPSNSVLPHVRSDVARYLKEGATGLANLMITYHTRLAPDLFAELKGGYLEDMFAGVGGQVLWRPDNSRLAFGADIYHVWQRDFDRRFGLQPYDITTGHVSMYYNSPWYGLNFNIHAGRYLAGDYGATFELTRRFDTGIELGAYATFTNVPFDKFGEGSFDKGIIARIPLEWGLPVHSSKVFDLTLRSLSRDGGQRLKDDDSLYNETIGVSYGEMNRHLDDVLDP